MGISIVSGLAKDQEKAKNPPPSNDFQCHFIDLPGEQIECVRVKDHIKVILRKHRDVIVHVKLPNNPLITNCRFYCN